MGLRDVSWVKRSGKGFIIHSSRIRVGPWGNARTDITPEMIITRAKSLIIEGQKKPVKGLISECGEWFELIDGEIRLLAWKKATDEGIDLLGNGQTFKYNLNEKHGGLYCEIEEGFTVGNKINRPTTEQAIKIQLSYGTDSEPMSEYDKARSVSKLVESGEKISDLAVILHCSEQNVRNLLAINSAPDRVKQVVKPTAALKYVRASVPTKNKIDKKIIAGEKVKCKDIPAKSHEAETVEQKIISIPTGKRLTDEEVQALIKKADANMCREKYDKGRMAWQYFIRALRMVLGYEEVI